MDVDVHFMLSSFIVKSLVQCLIFTRGYVFRGDFGRLGHGNSSNLFMDMTWARACG